ncbi:hypothetical protein [Actinoplanes sp. ATCC 53533]|nr:hypothetical protein [Actinoplanes sp. ATCC 53533]
MEIQQEGELHGCLISDAAAVVVVVAAAVLLVPVGLPVPIGAGMPA